ncbi:MAG TPA: cell wall-binding repeat-containing protein [Candidatus Limnocylindria bacterium]|nr:cell wall-binding repeat-containing protein [Candidatus Limnocylindria bacterium]
MSLRPRRLITLAVGLSLLATSVHLAPPPVAAVDGTKYVALANQRRASEGKPAVAYHALLEAISHERAIQMASVDNFSHNLAYVDGRLKAAGACFTGLGEIIAWEAGYATYDPARTMASWWASPGHHAVIVGDYNAAGGSHATAPSSGRIYSAMVWVKFCTPPPTGGDVDITRLAGADRYATAAAISRARFAAGPDVAYVATGTNFPDALAGAAAAGAREAPVLLVRPNELPAATRTELARLRPGSIVVLGGKAAVSEAVRSQLVPYATSGRVYRLAGSDRYGTAAILSRSTFDPGVSMAYVATGRSFPDALSGGALAGRDGGPVLLTEWGSIPYATRAELARLRPGHIVVLGGTGAVSEGVRNQLVGYATTGKVFRLAGSDRYATAVVASQVSYRGGSEAAFVATGTTFPDGLAGGPVAALVPGPVLLVKPTSLPTAVATELRRLDPEEVVILGSSGAVSNTVVNQINAALDDTPTAPTAPAGCDAVMSPASGDRTAAIQSFLAAGGRRCLAPGNYLVNGRIHLQNVHGLTIDGQGARLYATVRNARSMLLVDGGSADVTIRNLTIEGYNPYGRTRDAWDLAYETGHGIAFGGVQRLLVEGVKVLNVNGDGLFFDGGRVPPSWTAFVPNRDVTIRNILIDGTGRNGIAITNGAERFSLTASTIRNTGIYAFDIEPDQPTVEGDAVVLSGISVTGNRFDHYTISDEWGPLLFAGSGFAPQRNVTFSNNTVVGQPMRLLIQPNGYSRSYFTFAGNKSDTPAAGPLIWASGCDHLTVTGNVQPLTSGVLTDLRC